MVERIFSLFQKEWHRLTDAAILLALFALLSQLLALVRDRIFAHQFGAGETLDLYYAAFRIPDLLFALVASFVSAAVIIPLFVDRAERSPEEAQVFFGRVLAVFSATLSIMAFGVALALPLLLDRFFPSIALESRDEFLVLSRILLLSPILLGISSILGSVAQAHRKFLVYALSPVLYNVGIILGVLFLYPVWGVVGLGMGVVLGALLHMAVNIPAIAALPPRFLWRGTVHDIKSVIVLSLPRTLGLSLGQITLFVLIAWAALLHEGSVTVFTFAFNLQSVPLSIIGVSFSVAAFPTLARFYAEKNTTAFLDHMMGAARQIIFWSLPAVVLAIVLRAQVVRTILGSGAFTWDDTRLTAAAFALFAVSLAVQSLILLFVRAYYAAGNTKTPLWASGIGAVTTIGATIILLPLFAEESMIRSTLETLLRVSDVAGTEVLALPLAYTIGVFLQGWILLGLFRRDFGAYGALRRTIAQSALAALMAGGVAYAVLDGMSRAISLDTFWGVFLQGLVAGVLGIITAALTLKALKSREYEEVARSIHARFWKEKVIAPSPEEL
ncbi:MAG: hypothetical protein A2591_03495 [Candidatus Yonathbacteria bacterium RIFOXYD1_FULL_52_36]|uniref:Lipid II flippase MurJ n=1 Tax=Candidatus Yonathbacteria bacterium RIFOXYD1_FULL_52_36 TaxID=1802730 RepID=A0A1G2SM01_9BACT|nr:MAG: hypothetical protein A2591_03495 [Candidatus Yonathbacteria bacterium RIFOXYD1_FULL_52_36]